MKDNKETKEEKPWYIRYAFGLVWGSLAVVWLVGYVVVPVFNNWEQHLGWTADDYTKMERFQLEKKQAEDKIAQDKANAEIAKNAQIEEWRASSEYVRVQNDIIVRGQWIILALIGFPFVVFFLHVYDATR